MVYCLTFIQKVKIMKLFGKKKKEIKKLKQDFKEYKDLTNNKINALETKVENVLISRILNNTEAFKANSSKRVQLMVEAKEKGFFDENVYFTPFDWDGNGVFCHSESDILSNYGYDEEYDVLRIPAIGNKGKGRVAIYKNGKFAPIYQTKTP